MFKKVLISILILISLFVFLAYNQTKEEKPEVKIYFSNSNMSEECDETFPVIREVESKNIENALNALFAGPTQKELDSGFSSWFFEETKDILNRVEIREDNVVRLDIKDVRDVISGANSSCGSAQFFSSIENTLKEFNQNYKVIISINEDVEAFYEWMQIGCTQENNYCDKGNLIEKTGNIVINNPGLEKDTWYLVYEEEGSPALSVELIFGEDSLCQNSLCDDFLSEEMIGCRVKIEGELTGNAVKVKNLFIEE